MRKSKKSIFVYFLEMLIVFIIIDLFISIIAGGVANSSLIDNYGHLLITEIFYSFTILIVMLLFNNSYVFTEKKENFWNGVLLAIPILIVSMFNFVSSILNIGPFSIPSFINMFIFCIFVGIAEEFLCRGWIQNEFIERYSSNKKEVVTSIILSSFIFGFMHIVNIGVQTTFETVLQIINATALGFLLGSIYYKTKNIWSVIFLHGFYDFAIMLGEVDLIKNCTYNNPTVMISIYESFNITLISILWILGAIYVLNKCDFDFRPKKHNNAILCILMGTILLILTLPIGDYIPDYDNYKICYNYKEISKFDDYVIHYPYNREYEIKIDRSMFFEDILIDNITYKVYKNSDNKIVIKNENTSYEKVFEYSNVKDFEVFENNNVFVIVIETSENESTLYVSNTINKTNMTGDNSYLDRITFNSYSLPEIANLGYIENNNEKYVYALTTNNNEFIIKETELFVIK